MNSKVARVPNRSIDGGAVGWIYRYRISEPTRTYVAVGVVVEELAQITLLFTVCFADIIPQVNSDQLASKLQPRRSHPGRDLLPERARDMGSGLSMM